MPKRNKQDLLNLKLKFLELYELGHRTGSLSSMLHISYVTCQSWCYLISIFGKDVFLATDSTKMHYDYETKLAALKDFLENGLNRREVMAKYGIVSLKAFESWKRLYEAGGPEALMHKTKGRPKKPNHSNMSREEQLEQRIKDLEVENAILKKVMALKASKG